MHGDGYRLIPCARRRVESDFEASPPFPGRAPTHWVSGGRKSSRKNGRRGGGVVPPGIKVCSAQQRRRTPVAFAEWLIELAKRVEPRRET